MGNNTGATGLTPARRRYKALADMAASHGVVNGIKKKKSTRSAADIREMNASKRIDQSKH